MVKLFATIRPGTKYVNQQPKDAEGNALPFEVHLDFEDDLYYPVKGGRGGYYRFCDVDLFVRSSGKFAKLPLHEVTHRPTPFAPERIDGTAQEEVRYVQVEEVGTDFSWEETGKD